MKVGEICNRVVVFSTKDMPLFEAGKLMREHHVGCLLVLDETDRGRIPIGILTDRDIVVEVLAAGLDYRTVKVGEIMNADLFVAREEDDILDALQLMRRRGVRRLPVILASGVLVGIVTIDDLLGIVAEQLDDLVKAIASEQSREARVRL